MSHLSQALMAHLEKKGMNQRMIPGFIKDVANTVLVNPQIDIGEINYRLEILGWDHLE